LGFRIREIDTHPETKFRYIPKPKGFQEVSVSGPMFTECPTSFIKGKYFYYFIKAVDKFKDWVVYNRNLPSGKIIKCKELAEIIRTYRKD
jgi:hypothetical protein